LVAWKCGVVAYGRRLILVNTFIKNEDKHRKYFLAWDLENRGTYDWSSGKEFADTNTKVGWD
jgi:hypothetical protein